MFVSGGCKERRREDMATNGGEKLENAKENEKTPLEGKKNKKGVRKLTCVNGKSAGGGENRDAEKRANVTSRLTSDSADETPKPRKRKKLKKMKEDEPDNMNNTPTPGQGEGMEGEITPASKEGRTEVTAANNKEPKRERKRKNKVMKVDEAGGSAQDMFEEDGHPAKKIKTESMGEETEEKREEGNCDSHKEATTGLDTEGPVKKKRRKRRRKKRNPDATEDATSKAEEDATSKAEEDATGKAEKKTRRRRRRRGRRKWFLWGRYKKKQEGIQTSLPNTSGNEPSDTHAAQAQLEATTALRDSTQESGMQLPILHPSCASQKNKERIAECWKGSSKQLVVVESSAAVITHPFTCCYIHHLLQDEAYLNGVKKELDNIELISKNNDLYKFRQTGDLKGVTSPFIAHLRNFLYTEMRQWLIDITGIPLSDVVDMGSSRYSRTDVLLCHDDELEGRRIAYILYLVPPWEPRDGGSLDLFTTDGDGHPLDIVMSLVPKNNAFAFFEVSPVSFHQVSEVSCDKTRLSINGWFHGPPVPRPKRSPPPRSPLQGPTHLEEEDFYAWINPMYLDMNIQKLIRQKFCSESELKLENFLTDEAYKRLSGALRDKRLSWKRTGPADRQRYEILSPDSKSQDVQECQQFLGCEALFLVLSQLTGLKLHPLVPQDSDDDDEEEKEEEAIAVPNPRCHVEAQRWGPGCYTLIRDDCVDGRAALDAFLYVNVSQQWTQELGGHVTYIAKDEDEELLTVVPQSNCLCLVYRDAETLRFTKYITMTAGGLGHDESHFHSFACTYYE